MRRWQLRLAALGCVCAAAAAGVGLRVRTRPHSLSAKAAPPSVASTRKRTVGAQDAPSAAGVPMPTKQQIEWLDTEIGIMVSFDMITMLPDVVNPQHFCLGAGNDPDGFAVPPASAWSPSELNFTDSWMEAAKAVGAGYTLMVASHCSGFLQWPSSVYAKYGLANYTTAASPWRGGKGDVVADYMASAQRYGLPASFYLSLNYQYVFNYGFLQGVPQVWPGPLAPGQVNLSSAAVQQFNVDTIVEVWQRYPGLLFELWFDGGENIPALNEALVQYQPQAMAVGGTADTNNVRLAGAEGGFVPYPNWATGTAGQNGEGDPAGPDFVPAEMDTPILQGDTWFWKPGVPVRPLEEMKAVYHNSVGAGAVLELGVMPDNTGFVPADQMALLQGLGDFIRRCYGPAAVLNSTTGTGTTITLNLPPLPNSTAAGGVAAGAAGAGVGFIPSAAYPIVDRLVLQEDMAVTGQAVGNFTVGVDTGTGYKSFYLQAGTGQSIGHKRIHFLATGPIPARSIQITVTGLVPGAQAVAWRNVAAYGPCQ